ncbi:MAG: TRAP transporter substrate-binding protein DctP, partial [Planctomycetota bacterium]
INSFYASPLGAIVFQWYPKIKYMLDYPMVNSSGALVVKKDIFYSLSKKNQAIIREVARKFCNELIRLARKENTEALKILKKNGITFENPLPAQIISLQQTAKTIYQKHMDDIYSTELFQKVQDLLLAYRKSS